MAMDADHPHVQVGLRWNATATHGRNDFVEACSPRGGLPTYLMSAERMAELEAQRPAQRPLRRTALFVLALFGGREGRVESGRKVH